MQQNERTLANGLGHSGMLGQLAKTFALDFAACEQPAPFTLLPVPLLGVSIGMERRWQASKWHALRAPPDRDGLTVLLSFLHPHSTSNWLLLPSCARTDHGAAFPRALCRQRSRTPGFTSSHSCSTPPPGMQPTSSALPLYSLLTTRSYTDT